MPTQITQIQSEHPAAAGSHPLLRPGFPPPHAPLGHPKSPPLALPGGVQSPPAPGPSLMLNKQSPLQRGKRQALASRLG